MTLISRDALQGTGTTRHKDVTVPNLGTARLQNLSTSEMRKFRNSFSKSNGDPVKPRIERLQELLVAQCLVDEAGKRLFSDGDVMVGAFDNTDGAVIAFLYQECRSWSGFNTDGDWAAVEDAAKN